MASSSLAPGLLTGVHQQALEEARRIAREVLLPIVDAGEPRRVNRDLAKALGDTGLLGRLFGVNSPGPGYQVSAVTLCLLREGLAQESTQSETALATQGLGSMPILQAGDDALIERWIPRVVAGDAVAAFALTEPGGGSDAAAISLQAEPDGDGYRLTGEKKFISNAPDADVYTVFVRTTPDTGAKGVSAFAVPGDAQGLRGEPLDLVGSHAVGTLTFDGVFVPADHLLGELDHGFRVAMRTLDLFRPSVGAFAVGMAQAALDAAVEYADEREAFGQPIREFQAVSHRLAEMQTRLEAARLLVYSAAKAYDEGMTTEVTRRSSMAKLYATETAQFVVDAAVQIHGARALEEDHLLAHLYQEVRAPRIYEGTSEIQRGVIARELYRHREAAEADQPV